MKRDRPSRSRSCAPSLRLVDRRRSGSPADKPQLGRCHAPIKSRRRSSGGDGRQDERQVRPTGRQAVRESARRQPETYLAGRTSPPRRRKTLAVTVVRACADRRLHHAWRSSVATAANVAALS